jgi:UDP-3-O-[3-hydroxymyristoyl] glucosamine N-acyltransferase
MKLGEIASTLGLPAEGDLEVEITGVAGLDDAGPSDLSFVTGPRYRRAFERSAAGAVLLPPGFESHGRACLRSQAPYADFARAIELLMPARPAPEPGVHPLAVVAPDASLGAGVSIGPYAVIGARVRIGEGTRIYPHVTLYDDVEVGRACEIHAGACLREGVRLGDRVRVQNGVVLGADGFGFTFTAEGRRIRVPHRSPVEVGDDCEIGANTTIDASHPGQPRYGHAETRTRLGRNVKLDNLVQVGHGCEIGDGSTLCAQTGLAGSTRVGRNVVFGGQSATAGHLEVGDGSMVGARAAPASDVEPGAQLLGSPAMERRAWGRFVAARKRIPELFYRLRRIEERLGLSRAEQRVRLKGRERPEEE